jgi:hypothetical protein
MCFHIEIVTMLCVHACGHFMTSDMYKNYNEVNFGNFLYGLRFPF